MTLLAFTFAAACAAYGLLSALAVRRMRVRLALAERETAFWRGMATGGPLMWPVESGESSESDRQA